MKLKRLLPVLFMTIISLTAFFSFSNVKRAEAAVMLEENISAKVTGNSLTLSWKAPDGYFLDDDEVITGYRVGYSTVEPELWYDIDNDENWTVAEVSADTYTYTITGLKYSTDYYYSVACVSACDSSQDVDWAYTKKIATTGGASSESFRTPKISGMYGGVGNTLAMAWDSIKGADSYKLAYSTNNKTWTYINGINKPYYDICGLNFCTKYYVKVVVMKNGREASGWSDVECVSTKTYAAPANIKASKVYYNYLTVSWNKVNGVNGYQIAYSTDNKTWNYKMLGDVSSYKITNLKYNTKYNFKVIPLINDKKCGKWSSVQSAYTKAYVPPSNIKASVISYNYLTFSWSKADAVTGYKIAYSTDKKNWTYKALGNVTSYKITGLKPQSKYYVKIVSLLNNKECSKWSAIYTVTTNKYLNAPANIKAKKTCLTATISWNKVSGANGYRIEYSLDKKNWTRKNLKDVSSAKLTSLKFGSKYYIRMVCLKNGVISGKYSKTYYFTTNSLQQAVVTTKVTSNSINVSWKSIKGAQGYKVYCASTDGNKKITITMGKGTSWVIDELSPNTKYQLYVVPLQNDAIAAKYKTYYVTTALLSAPANITAANNSTSIDLKWKKVSGANAYKIAYSTSANGNWKYMTVKNVDNCAVKKLNPTTKYFYRVAAYKNDKQISKFSAVKTVTTKAKNLQYVQCPSCIGGSGRCRTCGGSGDCRLCHGTGMSGHYACHGCGGSRSCSTCRGSGRCRVCGGIGKVLADLNA